MKTIRNDIASFTPELKEVSITVVKGDYIVTNNGKDRVQIVVDKVHTSSVTCFVTKQNTPEPCFYKDFSIIGWNNMLKQHEL